MENKSAKEWQVYLLECSDQTLYCGVTKDIESRVARHNLGTAARYTRSRRPVSCVARSPWMKKSDAFALEYRIKRLPREEKARWVTKGTWPGKAEL